MTEVLPAPFVQLLGIGVLWISAHCVGMCGPLVTALDVAGARRGHGPWGAVGRTLQYQAGRAMVYAGWGALAGTVGKASTTVFNTSGAVIAAALGIGLVLSSARKLWPRRAMVNDVDLVTLGRVRRRPAAYRWLRDAAQGAVRAAQGQSPALLGMMMGFLPCMVTAWALGLAALTGSPAWGALLMVTLVVLTSPMLIGVGLVSVGTLPALRSFFRRVAPAVSGVAGLWMLAIAAAGVGLIDHAHLSFLVDGRHYMIMFW